MVVDNIKSVEKIKNFLKFNSYLVWICFLILTLGNIIIINGLKSDIQKTNRDFKKTYTQMKDLVEKEVSGVVVLANNGLVLNAEKSFLDASTESYYNQAIKNTLINYLVFSNNEITKNFTISFKKTDDLFAYEPLQEFRDNFLIVSKDNKIQTRGWDYILSNIATNSNEKTMPDAIDIIDSNIANYAWDTKSQSFNIVIQVSTKAFFWNSILRAYDESQGYFTIKASGTIAVKNNTILNPLGIKFTQLELNVPIRKK